MNVSPDDLDWCLDGVAAANPAFVMALPTKQDPMLSYLTTGFHDHLRLRARHGFKINDAMTAFFKRLGVMDPATGAMTAHAGDPVWVYLQYRRAGGDSRPDATVLAEGRAAAARVQARGVTLALGHGAQVWEPRPELSSAVQSMYVDAKRCLFAELDPAFVDALPGAVQVASLARSRWDYIVRPYAGEALSSDATITLQQLRDRWQSAHSDPEAVLVVSEGLSAPSIADEGHLPPFIDALRRLLVQAGVRLAADPVLLREGRVRGGYAVGAVLFGQVPAEQRRVVIHALGERPGTPHHNYSVYVSGAPGRVWAAGSCDHHMARVVAGVSDTALQPAAAAVVVAELVVQLLKSDGPPPKS
jgi:ethanolamine ammonia-lyase large subunit